MITVIVLAAIGVFVLMAIATYAVHDVSDAVVRHPHKKYQRKE